MQFDYEKLHYYSVDYFEILQYFNNQNLFENNQLQLAYLQMWISKIKSFDPPKNHKLPLGDLPEVFSQPLSFGRTSIIINFNVNSIITHCSSMKKATIRVPTNYFSQLNNVVWNLPHNNFISSKNTLILIVAFPNEYSTFLVIDGNHRIKNSLNTNKKLIDAYIFNDYTELLNIPSAFMSEQNKLVYQFINELEVINMLHNGKHKSDQYINNHLSFDLFTV